MVNRYLGHKTKCCSGNKIMFYKWKTTTNETVLLHLKTDRPGSYKKFIQTSNMKSYMAKIDIPREYFAFINDLICISH